VFVILCYCVCNFCVVYWFKCLCVILRFFVYCIVLHCIVLCIVVSLPPGTYPLAVNNNNNNYYYYLLNNLNSIHCIVVVFYIYCIVSVF
jgi:hypothetical protein